MKFIRSMIFYGSLIALATGCSLKPEEQTKIRISFPEGATTAPWFGLESSKLIGLPSPSTLDEFDCFGVNVTGPDIQTGSFNSSCLNSEMLNSGIIGGLAPIQGGSIDVMVPRGIRRTFQLFVVQSQKKIGCPALSEVWSQYLGSSEIGIPMEVGRTTADILGDAEVTIKAVWDPANPKPLFCSAREGVPVQLAILGKSKPQVSECAEYAVELQDHEEVPVDAPWDLKVTLGLQGGGSLYQDDACSTPLESSQSITLGAGSSSEKIYFRKDSSGSVTLSASAVGLKDAKSVISPQKSDLIFIVEPPSSVTLGSLIIPSVEVGIYDVAGELIRDSSSSTEVTLDLYSDSECKYPVSGGLYGNIASSSHGIAVFSQLIINTSGSFYLGASAASSVSVCSSQPTLIMPNYFPIPSPSASPSLYPRLNFSVLPSNGGQLSGTPLNGLLKVHAYDSTGALYSGSLKIVLDVYEDPYCTIQSGLNDLSISNVNATQNPIETSTGVAHFTNVIIRNPGTVYFGAKANGMIPACSPSSIQIEQGPAVQLEILGNQYYSIQYTGNEACQEYRIRALDSTRTPTVVTTALPISLTQSGTGMIYTTSDCSVPLSSSFNIPSFSSETSFWFKDPGTVPQMVTLNASASGMTSASYKVVEVLGGSTSGSTSYPVDIKLKRDQFSVPAGRCEGPFTLSVIDSQGSKYIPTSTAGAMTIHLSSAPSVTFYSSCSGSEIYSVSIDSSTLGEARFYVRTLFPGLFEIEAHEGSGKLRTMKDVFVATSSQTPDRLVFAGGGEDGSPHAQECSSFGVVAIDSYEYPAHFNEDVVFNLNSIASSGNVNFYEDDHCLVPSTHLIFKQGSGVALLKYKSSASGKVMIQVQNSIYGASAMSLNVLPPVVRQLLFQGQQSGIQVNECREFQVIPADAMGNTVSLPQSIIANLGYQSTTSLFGSDGFYTDSNCANSLTGNRLTLPAGSSGASVWFKGGAQGVFTLFAEYFELWTSKFEISVGANGVDHVQFEGPAYGIENTCYGPFQLTAFDSNGFTVPVSSTVLMNLNDVNYFSTDHCDLETSITTVQIQSGQKNQINFGLRILQVENS